MAKHLPKIDVLRGVAIILVFGFHALLILFGNFEIYDFKPSWVWIDFSRHSLGRILLSISPWGMGTHGVTLFLVISGFLIHWAYLKSGAGFRWSAFFNKRFWRIYPPYLMALLVFALSLGTGGRLSLLTHLTLTHNFFDRTFATINPSFWSLALEVQLYLLYPVLLWLRRRLGMGRTTVALGLLSGLTMGAQLISQLPSPWLWLSPLNLWVAWALGAYMGELFYQEKRFFTGSGYHLAGLYLLLTLARLTVLLVLHRIAFAVFFICVIDWYLHRPEHAGSLITRKLVDFTALVGVCSYSIYLFHQPFLRDILTFISFGSTNKLVLLLAVGTSFGLFLGLAYGIYHWLELPSIRWGQRLYQRFGPAAPRAALASPPPTNT
jgi:peptidoglycan/LPS O-acetylase OafA/YrhL